MKKLAVILLSAFVIGGMKIPDVCAEDETEISAKAAVVISADTGEVLFEHNSNEKLPMASTTKIMTTLICLESGNLDEPFVVDSDLWDCRKAILSQNTLYAAECFCLRGMMPQMQLL